jgi:protein-L-isoaspartate(D-aspartate) O-methyltransferase
MIPDWASERKEMVRRQLKARGISDPRVLAAMGEIPREAFVPAEARLLSYIDHPVAIAHGQTISQPYMTAFMAQALELKGSEKVLEVGAGSGYHAAVLGALAREVITLELIPDLAALARRNLQRCGLSGNITVVAGDGSKGYPTGAPYDAISVAAGAPAVPEALTAQLSDGGRLVIPVGGRTDQDLLLLTRRGAIVTTRVVAHCSFVPLRGEEGWR